MDIENLQPISLEKQRSSRIVQYHNLQIDPLNMGIDMIDIRSRVELKENHKDFPFLLDTSEEKQIFVDTKHPRYNEAYSFLIQIAEYKTRPVLVHTYKITLFSIYAAMVLGQNNSTKILEQLLSFSKNKYIPSIMYRFIQMNSQKYGSATISLINTKDQSSVGEYRLKIEQQEMGKLRDRLMKDKREDVLDTLKKITDDNERKIVAELMENKEEENSDLEEDEKEETKRQSLIEYEYYTIKKEENHKICEALVNYNIPYVQEYLYEKDDKSMDTLEISKYNKTKIRPYQEKALENAVKNGRARSGIIILPCGAGKTLVGVMICKTIKRSTIVLCERDVQIDQWKNSFINFCNIQKQRIVVSLKDTAEGMSKDKNPLFKDWPKVPPFILILTYDQLSSTLNKSSSSDVSTRTDGGINIEQGNEISRFIKNRDWGLLLADECQTLPAETYQSVLKLGFKVKIGLTATPYRGDNNIKLLYNRIGPKLYEENLLDLINRGYLATPYCIDLRCKMPSLFLAKYKESKENKKSNLAKLLHQGNSNKLRALKYLVELHEARGDTIIIFIDSICVLDRFAAILNRPKLHGKCSLTERLFIFEQVRQKTIQTIFVSTIGDTGIDLPDANVGIQICGFFKSQRQEVQRLGRIMRAKPNQCGEINAYFYNLVSLETSEVSYCYFRQQCLINQGLNFEIIDEEKLYGQNMEYTEEDREQEKKLLDKYIDSIERKQ